MSPSHAPCFDSELGCFDSELGCFDSELGCFDSELGRFDSEVGCLESTTGDRRTEPMGERRTEPGLALLEPARERSRDTSNAASPGEGPRRTKVWADGIVILLVHLLAAGLLLWALLGRFA